MQIFLFVISCLFVLTTYAEKKESFSGIAKVDGKVVYIENHQVTFDDNGNVLEAETIYTDLQGKILGILKSDFRESLSLPAHVFLDERTKGKYGVRRRSGKIEMFNQDNNEAEETKMITNKEDLKRVQIGCQGFNYFLKSEIENIIKDKSLPVLFMVPGDLSTYQFVLEFMREGPNQIFEFKIKIENWLLRVFAPEFEFKYDRKIHRIIWYKGLSNLKNENGKNQSVEIDYKF